jgi:hypothetical protein
MPNLIPLEPVDYLVIGHVAHDLTPQGPRLGGTAAYSALTARALGYRAGIVTACGPDWPDCQRSGRVFARRFFDRSPRAYPSGLDAKMGC